jgi:hypothetical protein
LRAQEMPDNTKAINTRLIPQRPADCMANILLRQPV